MLWRRGKSYSQDLRERVFAAADDGERVGRIAIKFQRVLCFQGSVAPCTDRANDGAGATLPRGSQTERPTSGNPGGGGQPSRCDYRRIARLAA
jgi:hypothetical protein